MKKKLIQWVAVVVVTLLFLLIPTLTVFADSNRTYQTRRQTIEYEVNIPEVFDDYSRFDIALYRTEGGKTIRADDYGELSGIIMAKDSNNTHLTAKFIPEKAGSVFVLIKIDGKEYSRSEVMQITDSPKGDSIGASVKEFLLSPIKLFITSRIWALEYGDLQNFPLLFTPGIPVNGITAWIIVIGAIILGIVAIVYGYNLYEYNAVLIEDWLPMCMFWSSAMIVLSFIFDIFFKQYTALLGFPHYAKKAILIGNLVLILIWGLILLSVFKWAEDKKGCLRVFWLTAPMVYVIYHTCFIIIVCVICIAVYIVLFGGSLWLLGNSASADADKSDKKASFTYKALKNDSSYGVEDEYGKAYVLDGKGYVEDENGDYHKIEHDREGSYIITNDGKRYIK